MEKRRMKRLWLKEQSHPQLLLQAWGKQDLFVQIYEPDLSPGSGARETPFLCQETPLIQRQNSNE